MPTRSFWASGHEESAFNKQEIGQLRQLVWMQFGSAGLLVQAPPALIDLSMPKPRLQPPTSLAHLFSIDRQDRRVTPTANPFGTSFAG